MKLNEPSGLSRRRFLAAAGGCALIAGCEVAEVRTAGGADVTNFSFDISASDFEALKAVGGMVPYNAGEKQLLLIRANADEVVALDRICPHLQCPMTPGVGEWLESSQTLKCNCHSSQFRADGTYVEGSVNDGTSVSNLGAYATTFDPTSGKGEVNLG